MTELSLQELEADRGPTVPAAVEVERVRRCVAPKFHIVTAVPVATGRQMNPARR
jgi:hypothetical protein